MALLITVAWVAAPSERSVFAATPGMDLQDVLNAAPSGSVVELAPGEHSGPVTIDRPLVLRGSRDSVIVAPLDADAVVTVTTPKVLLEGFSTSGGWTGIDLLSATGATIRDVLVEGSDAQGIRVYRRTATIEGVEVRALIDPHAQGIEVLSAPRVVVRDSTVDGGKIGIVGHLSTVRFEDNLVTGTSQVGIMIREMGSGLAAGNTIRQAAGAGLYCGDMSRCEFAENDVHFVRAAGNARSSAGWGLVVHYRSTASIAGDSLRGEAGRAVVLADSRMVPESPLRLGAGTSGIFSGLWAAFLALFVLAVCFATARLFVPRAGWRAPPVERLAGVAVAILIVGIVVQSFHMVEHWIQLYRVRFDGVPSRGGLAGSVAEVEWVHLVYNAAVLGGLTALVVLRRRGWSPPGKAELGDRLLLATSMLQGYHLFEHTLKVWQHTVTGAKVNPGLLGTHADLVLVHFGINAAVYLGFIASCLAYLWMGRMQDVAAKGTDPGVPITV